MEYIGSAASCLFDTITEFMGHGRRRLPDGTTGVYAPLLSIVQSSGTGKSRLIDELSKAHIVIPVNLRKRGEKGTKPHARVGEGVIRDGRRLAAISG